MMNNWNGIGRLTRDPEVRYTTGREPMAIANFTVAIDRPTKDDKADFIRITVFGRQAENAEKYLSKGSRVGISGSIQTDSYEKDGQRVNTWTVAANRIEYLETRKEQKGNAPEPTVDAPSGFVAMDYADDMPF